VVCSQCEKHSLIDDALHQHQHLPPNRAAAALSACAPVPSSAAAAVEVMVGLHGKCSQISQSALACMHACRRCLPLPPSQRPLAWLAVDRPSCHAPEPFPLVDWVAVPRALRARRANSTAYHLQRLAGADCLREGVSVRPPVQEDGGGARCHLQPAAQHTQRTAQAAARRGRHGGVIIRSKSLSQPVRALLIERRYHSPVCLSACLSVRRHQVMADRSRGYRRRADIRDAS
jgi:hypothetical protein